MRKLVLTTLLGLAACTMVIPATRIEGRYELEDDDGTKQSGRMVLVLESATPVDGGVAPAPGPAPVDSGVAQPPPDSGPAPIPDAGQPTTPPAPPTTPTRGIHVRADTDADLDPVGDYVAPYVMNRPTGQRVTDPVYGTTMYGLPIGARHEYSQLQAWSSDMSLMLMKDTSVIDTNTNVVLAVAGRYGARWRPYGHEVVTFDDSDGSAAVYAYDIDTRRERVAYRLPYRGLRAGRSHESMDRSGTWVGVYIDDAGNGATGKARMRVVAVNIVDERMGMDVSLADLGCRYEPDWVGVDPNGEYVVVQHVADGSGRCKGMELYDIETGAYVRQIHQHHQHSDMGLDADGTAFVLAVEYGHPRNNNWPGIVRYEMSEAYPNNKQWLRMIGWDRAEHLSCQGPPGSWCAMTATTQFSDDPMKGEVWMLNPISGEALRLTQHKSQGCGDYYAQPHATVAPTGTSVAFATTWGGDCTQIGDIVVEFD